jgi:hypothetical protein
MVNRTRWRAGEGVTSDLLPSTSSGRRGGGRLPDEVEALVRVVLRTRYRTRKRRRRAATLARAESASPLPPELDGGAAVAPP